MPLQTFANFDEYAAALGHRNVKFMALAKGYERWENCRYLLDDVFVRRARDGGSCFFEGALDVDGVAFVICPEAGKMSGNGTVFTPRSVMITPTGAEFQSVSFAAVTWLSAWIPISRLCPPSERENRMVSVRSRMALSPIIEVTRFCETLERIVTAASSGHFIDNHFGQREAARELVATARDLLWPRIHTEGSAKQLGRKVISRPEIIQRVFGHLERNSGIPAGLGDLAAIAGVSHRTLHNAFCEQFGMSPKRFLRLRALNLARRRLLADHPETARVTDIAVKLGIWELGRFSRDYNMLFGELPSQTLRRSR